MSWGLNIDALKRYEVVPTKLCENTTFQHYACTISHMLIIYQAYMANEVSRAAAVPAAAHPGRVTRLIPRHCVHQCITAPVLTTCTFKALCHVGGCGRSGGVLPTLDEHLHSSPPQSLLLVR